MGYSGPGTGFFLTTFMSGGSVNVSRDSYGVTANITSITFNQGVVTQLSGYLSYGMLSVPASSILKSYANSSASTLASLNQVASYFSGCAGL